MVHLQMPLMITDLSSNTASVGNSGITLSSIDRILPGISSTLSTPENYNQNWKKLRRAKSCNSRRNRGRERRGGRRKTKRNILNTNLMPDLPVKIGKWRKLSWEMREGGWKKRGENEKKWERIDNSEENKIKWRKNKSLWKDRVINNFTSISLTSLMKTYKAILNYKKSQSKDSHITTTK